MISQVNTEKWGVCSSIFMGRQTRTHLYLARGTAAGHRPPPEAPPGPSKAGRAAFRHALMGPLKAPQPAAAAPLDSCPARPALRAYPASKTGLKAGFQPRIRAQRGASGYWGDVKISGWEVQHTQLVTDASADAGRARRGRPPCSVPPLARPGLPQVRAGVTPSG